MQIIQKVKNSILQDLYCFHCCKISQFSSMHFLPNDTLLNISVLYLICTYMCVRRCSPCGLEDCSECVYSGGVCLSPTRNLIVSYCQ